MFDWGNIGHRGCGLDNRTVCLRGECVVNAKRKICCTRSGGSGWEWQTIRYGFSGQSEIYGDPFPQWQETQARERQRAWHCRFATRYAVC